MSSIKETLTHVYFWGSYLSQWHKVSFNSSMPTPTENGVVFGRDDPKFEFNCSEQFMMASKAWVFEDVKSFDKIMECGDPREQKALGRKVKGFDADAWDAVALNIVTRGNIAKFVYNLDIQEKLLATKNKIIVEGSPFDTIWGVGISWDSPLILDERNWRGRNLLGVALMSARQFIRNFHETKTKTEELLKESELKKD